MCRTCRGSGQVPEPVSYDPSRREGSTPQYMEYESRPVARLPEFDYLDSYLYTAEDGYPDDEDFEADD